jgi:NitT/TauT family transport system permease protein
LAGTDPITGALVGEFVGAKKGLGMLGAMFAVLIVLALMGVVLHGAVRMLHRRLIFWAEPEALERRTP